MDGKIKKDWLVDNILYINIAGMALLIALNLFVFPRMRAAAQKSDGVVPDNTMNEDRISALARPENGSAHNAGGETADNAYVMNLHDDSAFKMHHDRSGILAFHSFQENLPHWIGIIHDGKLFAKIVIHPACFENGDVIQESDRQ